MDIPEQHKGLVAGERGISSKGSGRTCGMDVPRWTGSTEKTHGEGCELQRTKRTPGEHGVQGRQPQRGSKAKAKGTARAAKKNKQGDKSVNNAPQHTPGSNCRERVPGANPDTPWPRTPCRVALPSGLVRVPGEEGGSRWPMGPLTVTPIRGDREVGAEPSPGGCGWTIP